MPKLYDPTAKFALLERVGFTRHFAAASWEEYNRKFFDGLAPRYDALNQVLSLGLHRRMKRRAIANLSIQPGNRVLDLCTGSGDVALWIARRHPACRVVGVDVSQEMLKVARARAVGLSNVTFEAADALRLPFEEASFDVAIISFGLRNLVDLTAGLREMRRVTKDGGQVTSLDLGKPRGRIPGWVYRAYFLTLIPWIGRAIVHRREFNSFRYLPESNRYFPSPEELVELFAAAGLSQVRNENMLFGAVAQQIGRVDRSPRGTPERPATRLRGSRAMREGHRGGSR